MNKTWLLAFAAAVCVPGIAAAAPAASDVQTGQDAQAEGDAQTEQAPPEEEKKICRTDRTTGSLTRRTRVCLTQAQWRAVHDRTRRGVGEMQGTAAGGTAIPNNPGG